MGLGCRVAQTTEERETPSSKKKKEKKKKERRNAQSIRQTAPRLFGLSIFVEVWNPKKKEKTFLSNDKSVNYSYKSATLDPYPSNLFSASGSSYNDLFEAWPFFVTIFCCKSEISPFFFLVYLSDLFYVYCLFGFLLIFFFVFSVSERGIRW